MSQGNMECYRASIDNVAEAVTEGVVSMHQFLLKVQQLNGELQQVEVMANDMYVFHCCLL